MLELLDGLGAEGEVEVHVVADSVGDPDGPGRRGAPEDVALDGRAAGEVAGDRLQPLSAASLLGLDRHRRPHDAQRPLAVRGQPPCAFAHGLARAQDPHSQPYVDGNREE